MCYEIGGLFTKEVEEKYKIFNQKEHYKKLDFRNKYCQDNFCITYEQYIIMYKGVIQEGDEELY